MKEYACSKCGHVTQYADDYGHYSGGIGWHPVERRRLYSGLAAPVESFTEYERVKPTRKPTVSGHFSTPALQALLSGFAALLIFIPIAAYLGLKWWWPVLAGGFAFALAWVFLVRYFNSLLKEVEHVTNAPPVAPIIQPAQTVRLEIKENNHSLRFAELPIDEATLRTVARAVLAGRAFSVASMCGRGKPLSRSQYEELRDWLLDCGYLKWLDAANRQAGVEFTAKGRALLKGLAS